MCNFEISSRGSFIDVIKTQLSGKSNISSVTSPPAGRCGSSLNSRSRVEHLELQLVIMVRSRNQTSRKPLSQRDPRTFRGSTDGIKTSNLSKHLASVDYKRILVHLCWQEVNVCCLNGATTDCEGRKIRELAPGVFLVQVIPARQIEDEESNEG